LIAFIFVLILLALFAAAFEYLAVDAAGWKGALAVTAAYVLLAYQVGMAAAAPHAKPDWLSKRTAQYGTVWFAGSVGPLLDVPEYADGVTVHVVAPSRCHRRTRTRVRCWFSVHLASQPVVRTGFMSVHLQRDGLLGYKLPWDPGKVGVGWD
jgi:hypothetical protein